MTTRPPLRVILPFLSTGTLTCERICCRPATKTDAQLWINKSLQQ